MGIVFGGVMTLQFFGIKTIIGGFITIGLILLIHHVFKNTAKNPLPVFLFICGVIFICTLILLTLALNTIILTRNWQ